MTARVIPLRPRPVPSSSSSSRPASSSSVPAWIDPVPVEWDGVRGLYIARCRRCAESIVTMWLYQADRWADRHRCDPELAALLDEITDRRAA